MWTVAMAPSRYSHWHRRCACGVPGTSWTCYYLVCASLYWKGRERNGGGPRPCFVFQVSSNVTPTTCSSIPTVDHPLPAICRLYRLTCVGHRLTVCPPSSSPKLSEQGELLPRNISVAAKEIGRRKGKEICPRCWPETLQTLEAYTRAGSHLDLVDCNGVRTQYPTDHTPTGREGAPLRDCLFELWTFGLLDNSNSTQSSPLTSPTPLHWTDTGRSNYPPPTTHWPCPPRTHPVAAPNYIGASLDDGRPANPALAPRSSTFLRQVGTPHRNNTLTVQPSADSSLSVRGTPIRVPPRHLTPSHMDHSPR
jgi:hypothetical protein